MPELPCELPKGSIKVLWHIHTYIHTCNAYNAYNHTNMHVPTYIFRCTVRIVQHPSHNSRDDNIAVYSSLVLFLLLTQIAVPWTSTPFVKAFCICGYKSTGWNASLAIVSEKLARCTVTPSVTVYWRPSRKSKIEGDHIRSLTILWQFDWRLVNATESSWTRWETSVR